MKKKKMPPMKSHWLYSRWHEMNNRCYNPNRKDYKYYGGKGICICDEWLYFWSFVDWFTKNKKKELKRKHIGKLRFEVDRINSNGDYCPKNCRLITHRENILHSLGRFK